MRQRLHEGGVDRQRGVEQMGEVDAQRLRHQPKEITAAVEAPRPPLLDDLQPRFVVTLEASSVKDSTVRELRNRTVSLIRWYTGTSSRAVLARLSRVYQPESCSSTLTMVVATWSAG
jgi:hypothetical protein